jgi:hypothetical protein
MPRIEKLSVELVTGTQAFSGPVQIEFNGHILPIDSESGATGPGERYAASYSPRSMSHSLHLVGPAEGAWSVEAAKVTIDAGSGPYSADFEPFVLLAGQAVSLWAERAAVPFDV